MGDSQGRGYESGGGRCKWELQFMNNAEDCARYLCELASKPDTSDLRKQMEATIDEYLIKERSRVELAAAFANCDVPNRELRAFILKTITRHVG
jgi:hypothetical protein